MQLFFKEKNSISPNSKRNIFEQQFLSSQQSFHSKNNIEKQDTTFHQRKSMNAFLYTMYIVAMIFLSFENVIFFFTKASKQKSYYCIFSFSCFTILFLFISKSFATFKQILALYFLLDSLTLALVVANIGLNGLVEPLAAADPLLANIFTYYVPIASFCMTGTVRIVIKNANFNRWQNITFKIVILADAMCYFGIGFYFMFYNFLITYGLLPQIDTLYKDFSLLFVFGGLAYYKQICNLHNRFDRTDKLKYTYKLVDEIEQQFFDQQNQNKLNESSHLKQQTKLSQLFKLECKVKRKEKANVTIQSLDL